jgi:hypothetical protein
MTRRRPRVKMLVTPPLGRTAGAQKRGNKKWIPNLVDMEH